MWLKGTKEGRVIRRNPLAEVHSLMHHLRSSPNWSLSTLDMFWSAMKFHLYSLEKMRDYI